MQEIFGGQVAAEDYGIHVRIYGRDGVLGKLESRESQIYHEVGLFFTIKAKTQVISSSIAKIFVHFALDRAILQNTLIP